MKSVAICLPTYNGQYYLKEQIDSILIQLKEDDKLYIADDGSTDLTLSIIESYGDKLHLIETVSSGGIVNNIERLLKNVCELNHDFIVLADQDDVWLDGRLDLIKALLSQNSLIMMNAEVVDANLRPIGSDIFNFVNFHNGFLKNFIANKYVGCCMAFNRKFLEVILPFPNGILWHDWFIALTGLLFFDCNINHTKTLLFRRHLGNLSITGKKSTRNLFGHLIIRFWMARALLIVGFRFYLLKLKELFFE